MALATSSTIVITDALASFAKAAHQAVADIENQARIDVAQASSEAIQARQQRDEAVKGQHTSQLEEKAWKQEYGACKVALNQAEMTIAHQAETISQLRREATQWKDQSKNWQDHFLRVEQERCKLSTMNDELVAAQLLFNNPRTPRPKYTDVVDSIPSSTSTKRASTSPSNQPPAYKSAIPTSPSDREPALEIMEKGNRIQRTYRPKSLPTDNVNPETPPPRVSSPRSVPKSTAIKRKSFAQLVAGQGSPTQSPTPLQRPLSPARLSRPEMGAEPRLIRRVQAVVQIPVKQEGSEDDLFDHGENYSPSTYVSVEGTGTSSLSRQTNTRLETVTKRRKTIQSDEDDEDYRPEEAGSNVSHDEEEDDELMMGAEDNRKQLYGAGRTVVPEIRILNDHSSTAKEAPASNKKRKTGGREKHLNKTRRL